MSFSLYGALPPSKTEKDSEKPETAPNVKNNPSGLYSSLPAPEIGSTAFQKTGNDIANPTITPSVTTATATPAPAQPTGWSAYNKFRPVMRRPTIQAKPKLNKPFIPAGATVVSTKTITKEERESLQTIPTQETFNKPNPVVEPQAKVDNIDLGAIPFLTTADDVNGFRATQKSKKKGKKGKANSNNTQPLPTVFNMLEDYDPHKPNDYEQYKEERRELREQQRKKREWERRQQHSKSRSRSWSRSRSRSRSRSPYSSDYSRSQSPEPISHESRPPSQQQQQQSTKNNQPKINVRESADEAYQRRMMMSQQKPVEPPKPSKPEEVNPAQEIAQKILAKYGWKEGQGLGSEEEGIKEALHVKPMGRGTGTIVDQSLPPPPPKPVSTENVSPVILLTNMVDPGEVDDMLQEETADECSKYGKVERCLIFEVPNGKIHSDRAVRIFVRFSEIESARRAINDLNGRFFGGRIVTASFFDKGRFDRLDLAPTQEEFYR